MPTLARHVWIALLSLVPLGVSAWWFAPAATAAFYSVAVQINPVFLVALAVEQSFAQSLGTEDAYVARKTGDELRQDESDRRRATAAVSDLRAALNDLAALHGVRSHTAPELRGSALEFDVDDHGLDEFFEDVFLGETTPREIVGELGSLSTEGDLRAVLMQVERAFRKTIGRLDLQASEREQRARESFRQIRRSRRNTLVVVTILLFGGEVMAFVGLLSPGQPYSGLFAATAASLGASFLAVTIGALEELTSAE